ncbi:dsRBD fold-containing protein [Kitasatospora sp. NPDC052896]|uniref:dsRBD fold-containing protein n=1 Tax=Kitasatospora sp. NPDC052896 TaxID=3364061 RepID=UPI0037C5FB49
MAAKTATAPEARTKEWALRLHLVEEGDLTTVDAVLDADGRHLETRAEAHRNPHDPPAAAIGDDLAVGRALVALGHQLIRTGEIDATAADGARPRADS